MSSLDRVLLVLFSLAVMIVSAYVLGAAAGLLGPAALLAAAFFSAYRLEVVLFSCLLFFLALRFTWLSVLPAEGRRQAGFVHQGELGQIKISLSALEQIAEQAVICERGVRRARIRLQIAQGGVVFNVRVVANSQQNLVMLAELLQQAIKKQVEKVTNVTVRDVIVVFSAVGSERPHAV